MRRIAGIAAATLVLLGTPAARAGSPAVPGPPGTPCTVTGDSPGYLSGGPYVGDGTLTCTVQVDDALHSGADTASASVHGTDVVVLAPTPVTYEGEAYVCTEFAVDGGPTLYWDGPGAHWTDDPETRCDTSLSILKGICPPPGDPCATAPEEPPKPYYPRATIEITAFPGGGTTYRSSGFEPPVELWGCVLDTWSVTCTPPAAPEGYYNVCGTVSVTVTNYGPPPVSGDTGCAYGRTAHASANASQPANANAAVPNAAFGWTCAAHPDSLALLLWTVRCNVAM